MKSRSLTHKIFFAAIALMFTHSSPHAMAADSSDSEMNQTRGELERQRIQKQIEEDQRRNSESIEDETKKESTESQAPALTFTLTDVTIDDSVVITSKILRDLIKPYVGREVSFEDVQKIVSDINDYYSSLGLLTCRAYLKPQKIEGGVVHVSLNEAINGKLDFKGNHSTTVKYIKRRLRLKEGQLQNFKHLDEDITRFNSTNDAQLHIALKPGTEPNTTDYEIVIAEPQRLTTSVSVDNLGQTSTGLWRESISLNYASPTLIRDDLNIGYSHAVGSNSFNFGYEAPVSRWGTRLRFDFSTNATEHKRGQFKNLIKGHSNYLSLALTHPLTVNLSGRSEWSLAFNSQSSKSTFKDVGTFANNRSDTADLSFTQINYKPALVIYQKHTYELGNAHSKVEELHKPFGLYKFYGFARKNFPHNHSLYARASAQLSSTKNLASADTFSIGGYYSVRGYKTQFLDGDSGFDFALEYSFPLVKALNAFTFFDYGKIASENSLMSTGLGLQFRPINNLSSTLVLGFPLKRHFDFEDVSKTRIHFLCSGYF